MIFITILFGLIIINKISLSFTSLIEVFLFVVAALVCFNDFSSSYKSSNFLKPDNVMKINYSELYIKKYS